MKKVTKKLIILLSDHLVIQVSEDSRDDVLMTTINLVGSNSRSSFQMATVIVINKQLTCSSHNHRKSIPHNRGTITLCPCQIPRLGEKVRISAILTGHYVRPSHAPMAPITLPTSPRARPKNNCHRLPKVAAVESLIIDTKLPS